ncbi:Zinc finger MYM-type protein 1 [Amphibalanus amphitrite]|uniref:Zinc finger MYM-type protein 1 n=1 Tax=Amphibalanus amphitrite TaxID=1232801 RepID=A0A6A4VK65_AMPAM|nr:Zinc finger MYM-type protein 1 [Amphibalanus amphitrite]
MMSVTGKAKDVAEAREALDGIFSAIAYLAGQGLPLRRREEKTSNLQRLLDQSERTCPALKTWRKRKQTFTSPEIQNEILELMASAIVRQIANSVREDVFAVMADETRDSAGTEQVAICLRSVNKQLEVEEQLIGLYSVESTTALVLSTVIKDALLRMELDLKQLRGQCYDGAANMSGKFKGVQALIKQEEPRAVFVHCTAHRLNLAVQDCMDGVRPLRDTIQETGRMIGFFRDSPKRLSCLIHFGADKSLRPLCPTRWTCSEPALASVINNYTAVLSSLEAIADDPSTRPDQASTASGHARRMQSFDFFFGLSLALHLLRMTTPVMHADNKTQSHISVSRWTKVSHTEA